MKKKEKIEIAVKLMDDFAHRTGLLGIGSNRSERYLWTDAFAVNNFFSLSHVFANDSYKKLALKLISEVHQSLGRFHPDDTRKGWISGLPEEQGQMHPTVAGLRIGKKLPERKQDEPFNERLEWERDGQYFHYLTQWIQTILRAEEETNEKKYALWAAELLESGSKFINKTGGQFRMYWKMSTDLSRALIKSMGAHDPLEGLVCALSIQKKIPENAQQLKPIMQDLQECCRGLDWSTTDPLGIGGLLLNIERIMSIDIKNGNLPEPKKLLADALYGLEIYSQIYDRDLSARQRLAFRECGLSNGLRTLIKLKEKPAGIDLNINKLDKYIFLADEIEAFWTNPKNQISPTWTEHLNINAVTLAASLIESNSTPF